MKKIIFSLFNYFPIHRLIGISFCSTLLFVNCYGQWTQQNSGTYETLNSINFCNASTGFCVGSNGTILKTNDGGTNWISLTNTYNLNYSYVKMFGPDTVIIASIPSDTILKSINGGVNWTVFDIGIPYYYTRIKCQFVNPNTGFFLTGSDLYRTTNGCISWTANYTMVGNRDMDFVNENTGWLCDRFYFPYPPGSGTYWSEICRTDNGGVNWTVQVHIQELSFGIYRVFFVNPILGFYNGFMTSSLSRTTNGYNWGAGVSGAGFYKNYYVMNFSSANTGWFSGDQLIRTTDGGANFESKTTPFGVSFKSIYFIDDLTGWMTSSGGLIIKTTTGGVTSINEIITELPNNFKLYQNYPNPFNPVTKIKFELPSDVKRQKSKVKLVIYNVLGKEIQTLVNEQLQPGTYEVTFDGSNIHSGVYFYQLRAGEYSETRKFVLLK